MHVTINFLIVTRVIWESGIETKWSTVQAQLLSPIKRPLPDLPCMYKESRGLLHKAALWLMALWPYGLTAPTGFRFLDEPMFCFSTLNANTNPNPNCRPGHRPWPLTPWQSLPGRRPWLLTPW